MSTIPYEHLLNLIEAGVQAPSADNCQPWKFKLIANGFELWLDPANMGLFFDVEQVATQMSCGAVIENVVTLANALGLTTDISYSASATNTNEETTKFAQLTFSTTAYQKDVEKVRQIIFNRHSNRNLFQFNKKISNALSAELSSHVQLNENYYLQTYHTLKDRNAIIRITTAVETIRFNHKQMHHDFYNVLRFGDSHQQTRDGLAAETLGIESLMIPVLAKLKPWFVTRILNYIGLHHIMAFRGTWLPMKSASQIVSIIHRGPVDYVESGRVIQRFWLQANQAGLSVQALGIMPSFFSRFHLLQGEGFNPTQLKILSARENDFIKITPEFNKETDQLVMMFRLGYEEKPASRSYRRETESFLM